MINNINKVIAYLKEQPIKGCITGSSLLEEYWDKMDVDCFVYDEKSFTKLIYAMHYNTNFQILDKLEQWKFDQFINKNRSNFSQFGILTIKFTYNTCIPVNIIMKKACSNIFSVISSFDMDILCKGYDIGTKQYLDLSKGIEERTASWNTWNKAFYDPEIWQVSRLLRQLERVFKYHKRGYNTDNVVLKYIDLINQVQEYQNIFNSENFSEKLKVTKSNTQIIKQLCEVWLKTHEISEKELQLLKDKIKKI